ncbi:MAG: hypothetical protein NC177_15530 [Ruminococcus flavefaciens]|nr:hypothetical protein [Ruminococcus flavefaciens]
MKESKEPAMNSESNILDKKFPDEYLVKSQKLIDEYEKSLDEYRNQLTHFEGRDDRMNPIQKRLTVELRHNIAKLRKEYNLD